MFRINMDKLKNSDEGRWLLLDLFMIILLMINLLWIIFDALFEQELVRDGLHYLSPKIVSGYQPIHENFLLFDLIFVGIFFSEFLLRWFVSLTRKEYERWYFFPVIHWYDLVGCIPLAATRIFRFLRIFSILYRLNKYQIINLRNSGLFRFIHFYYDALVEEVTDRVVIKVLSDIQKELKEGTPIVDEMAQKVLASRRDALVSWVSAVMNQAGETIEMEMMGGTVKQHIRDSVSKAVRDNKTVSTLNLLPVVGGKIEDLLEQAVADIVINAMINLLKDITPTKVDHFMEHGVAAASREELMLTDEVISVVNDCLELVKNHVAQQKWREKL
jgi:hypothetical protein